MKSFILIGIVLFLTTACKQEDFDLTKSFNLEVPTTKDYLNKSNLIRVSLKPDRSKSLALNGRALNQADQFYIFIEEAAKKVEFILNDQPYSIETKAPFDMASTDDKGGAKPIDKKQLLIGKNKLKVIIDNSKLLKAEFYYAVPDQVEVLHSYSADRSSPQLLNNMALDLSKKHYIFVNTNINNIKQVHFDLNGQHIQTERQAPYDLAGTEDNQKAKAFNNQLLQHQNSLKVDVDGEVHIEKNIQFSTIQRSTDSIKKFSQLFKLSTTKK